MNLDCRWIYATTFSAQAAVVLRSNRAVVFVVRAFTLKPRAKEER